MTNTKRVMGTLTPRNRHQRFQRSVKANSWSLDEMSPSTLAMKTGIGPKFARIEIIGFFNRQGWSTEEKVGATHLRLVTHVIDDAFTRPELFHANRAVGALDELSHLTLKSMTFELVQCKRLLAIKLKWTQVASNVLD